MRQLKEQGATSCHCPETSHFKANSSFFMKIELNNKVSNDTFESYTKVRNNSEFLERNQVQRTNLKVSLHVIVGKGNNNYK